MLRLRGNPLLHFLDRYAGIPLVALCGCARRKRAMPENIQTVGLLRTAAIGDTVLISGVIADLRRAFPSAKLILFAGPSNSEIAYLIPEIDKIVELPIANPVATLKNIRTPKVDVMIDFGQWPRLDALFAFFANASHTIGFRTEGQHRHYAYDRSVEHSGAVHEIENFRRLVRALGVRTGSPPCLSPPLLAPSRSKAYAVFHLWPGGRRCELKQWPERNWIRLIEELTDCGVMISMTGGESDREKNERVLTRLATKTRKRVENVAGLALSQVVSLIASSRLVLSVNTGIMHVAAALSVPLVALHGPTSSKRWGPVSESAIAINSTAQGCGYLNLGWEYRHPVPPCMECIEYEPVRQACRAALERASDPPESANPASQQ